MPLVEALRHLAGLRREEIVVTTMGSAREWPKLSDHPRDFHYVPSAMGQATSLGVGLAIAQPDVGVWVLNGDGCMLMNLGALVTIVAAGVPNLTLFVLENSVFEITGGQKTAGAAAPVDFAAMAAAAGFASVATLDDLETWRTHAATVLSKPGPRMIVLRVAPVADYHLTPPGPIAERVRRFRAAL
jgi:thiamine pyrophosphate-dependent acetolactate synthase large subunit-like protein